MRKTYFGSDKQRDLIDSISKITEGFEEKPQVQQQSTKPFSLFEAPDVVFNVTPSGKRKEKGVLVSHFNIVKDGQKVGHLVYNPNSRRYHGMFKNHKLPDIGGFSGNSPEQKFNTFVQSAKGKAMLESVENAERRADSLNLPVEEFKSTMENVLSVLGESTQTIEIDLASPVAARSKAATFGVSLQRSGSTWKATGPKNMLLGWLTDMGMAESEAKKIYPELA